MSRSIHTKRYFYFLSSLFFLFVLGLNATFSWSRSIGFNFKTASTAGTGLSVFVFDDVTQKEILNSVVDITPTTNGLRSVHVSAVGYSDTTVIGLPTDGALEVFLVPHFEITPTPVLKGSLTNWTYPKKSKNMIAGVVFKTLSGFDLLNVDMNSFISPKKEQIDVFGKRDIPSNIILPEQTLQVFLMSVKLNKPEYQLQLKSVYPTSLTAMQLKVPGSELTKMASGSGDIGAELLNKSTIENVGFSKEFLPVSNQTLSFSAPEKLAPRFKVKLTKPAFAEELLVTSFVDMQGFREILIPSDIKGIEGKGGTVEEFNLSSPVSTIGHSREMMAIALSENGQKTSGVILQPQPLAIMSSLFLPIRTIPSTQPTVPDRFLMEAISDGMSVLTLEGIRSGGASPDKELLARIFVLPSVGKHEVELPQMSHKILSYSIVDMDFGNKFQADHFDGIGMMKEMQRFSRVSVNIQPAKKPLFFRKVRSLFL